MKHTRPDLSQQRSSLVQLKVALAATFSRSNITSMVKAY